MKNNKQEIEELLKNGQDQFKQNKFYDAIKLYKDALEICKKDGGELSEHPMAAEVLNKLGRVHISVANYQKAGEYLDQALSSLKQNHENNYALFLAGEVYNNLASLYIHLAQYTKAEEYLEISKSIFRNASQASDDEESDSSSGDEDDNDSDDDENNDEFNEATKAYYHNLIELNCAQLKRDEFEKHDQSAQEEVTDNNAQIIYNNILASAYNILGMALQEDSRLHKISKITGRYENQFNQVEIAKYYVNLANLKINKRKYSNDIFKTYVDALKIQQEIYGKQANHPDIAKTYCGLGDMSLLIDPEDKKGGAKSLFTRALEMQKEIYQSESHPDMIQVHYGLGRMFSAQKNYKEAANYFEKAIAIENQIFDKNYISAKGVIIKLALAGVYYEESKLQEAKDICEKEIDLVQTLNPWQDNSPIFFINMFSELIKQINDELEKIEIEQGLADLLAELNLAGEVNAEELLPDAQGESSQAGLGDQGSQLIIIGSHGDSAEIL